MRIVGGEFRRRALARPKSDAIRPTSDRTRETLFNMLLHRPGISLDGARVLDLFSGTGALGCEALSRGAKFCLFVEDGVEARGLIRQNIDSFGLQGRSKIFRRDATKLGMVGTMDRFDLLFADPPYRQRLAEAAIVSARVGGWLKTEALIVVEEALAAPFETPDGFTLEEERAMGETMLRFLRFGSA